MYIRVINIYIHAHTNIYAYKTYMHTYIQLQSDIKDMYNMDSNIPKAFI